MSIPYDESVEELVERMPPKFGHDMLQYFLFDPEYTNLNHGSYGSLPRPVLASCTSLTKKEESNPDVFTRLDYTPMLTNVRSKIAEFVGIPLDECVVVQNASHGLNTILRNIEWTSEDYLVVCSTTYNSVIKTVQYLSDRPPHPSVSTFDIRLPEKNSVLASGYREHLLALRQRIGPKPRIVAVIDSIMSNPGIYLPWKQMVEACREAAALSVVDGAHSVGQEELNLSEVQPDFFVSNCHKWLFSKRSCSFIYAPKRNQNLIKSAIPTPLTYLSPPERAKNPSNFVEQFDYNGTIDTIPYLSVLPALKFRKWIGGEKRINDYCRDLAVRGGKRLAELLGTELMDPDGEQTLNMVNVELPIPGSIPITYDRDIWFKTKMLREHKIYAAHFYHNNRWWTRVSAQIWVEMKDFERLAEVYRVVCKEIVDEARQKSKL